MNGTVLVTVINPEGAENFKNIGHVLGKVFLYKYDVIQIESKVMTNGKVTENDGAWSQGWWNTLKLVPNNF